MTEYSTSNMNKMRSADFHHHHHHHQMPSYSSVMPASSDIVMSTSNESYIVGQNTVNPVMAYNNTYAEMLTNPNESGNGTIFSNFYHQQQQHAEYMTTGQIVAANGGFMTSTNGYAYGAPTTQQTSIWSMDSLKKGSPPIVMGGSYPISQEDTNTTSSSVTTTSSSGSSTPTALTTLNNNGIVNQQLLKTTENNATLLTNLALADSSIIAGKKEDIKSTNVNSKASNLKQISRSKQQFKEELQLGENENNTNNKMKNRLGKLATQK